MRKKKKKKGETCKGKKWNVQGKMLRNKRAWKEKKKKRKERDEKRWEEKRRDK